MTKEQIAKVADEADLIVNGYAMTRENDIVRVLNLRRPQSSAVFDMKGKMLETTMDDVELSIVSRYLQTDFKYLGANVA